MCGEMDVGGNTSRGDGKQCVDRVPLKHEATNNGFVSLGATDGFRTYKRRRHGKSNSGSKLPEGRTAFGEATSLVADQSRNHWRNDVLQKMYMSLRDTGAIQDCIRDALSFHQGIDSATTTKVYAFTKTASAFVWRQLEVIGTEMSSLAKSLSNLSVAYCSKHIRKSGAKLEQPEDIYKVCICRLCGTTADGRGCLVCDSCEEMYHVSCIEPAVKEVPPKSWYCSICTGKGIGSTHENCAVCERLRASLVNQVAHHISPRSQRFKEFDENSNVSSEDGHQLLKGNEECKICRSKLKNGDEFRICHHALCDYKYYHTRCLTIKQLKSYCPHWYCPSCLCRICLTDKDDDQIVLCDACDEAYHTYCMSPPRSSIPKGKWFCVKCHSQIQQIRRVRIAYEKLQKDEDGKGALKNSENEVSENGQAANTGKCGVGMDMLLSAANTLNYEEKVAAVSHENSNSMVLYHNRF
ncbi:PHD finger protein EHD3-like isoform X2 [Tripterygium wilfordii]|uniref:PHD finger protein EHD3-like isoform X2 n=1 Tax=Tripterygium wilfordii TaxID=458696 RepID=UPI0018F85F51|nr:PHD finger protein EHD3-like isoform X2 [Tripterygium wilfordii]